jgi:hypothetical protein
VKLSPLAVLVAILLGTEIAGILGALMAIPVAGSIQVIVGELIQRREERRRSVVMGYKASWIPSVKATRTTPAFLETPGRGWGTCARVEGEQSDGR